MIRRLVLYNLRSTFNVGAILRTADAMGVPEVICFGTTPYPRVADDQRLPHEIRRAEQQISKTALGAERTVAVQYLDDPANLIEQLKATPVVLLEQGVGSFSLAKVENAFDPIASLTLVVGEERFGLPPALIEEILALDPVNRLVEIPMLGQKESLNVAVATGMALFVFNKALMI